jgi:hypothetical protein
MCRFELNGPVIAARAPFRWDLLVVLIGQSPLRTSGLCVRGVPPAAADSDSPAGGGGRIGGGRWYCRRRAATTQASRHSAQSSRRAQRFSPSRCAVAGRSVPILSSPRRRSSFKFRDRVNFARLSAAEDSFAPRRSRRCVLPRVPALVDEKVSRGVSGPVRSCIRTPCRSCRLRCAIEEGGRSTDVRFEISNVRCQMSNFRSEI